MSLQRTIKFVAFFAPLLIFILATTSPFYSARLSLILHGHPFAHVVPREQLNVFQFVKTDNFACRAIVFSEGNAVGWICQSSTGGFPSFVPFSGQPNLDDVQDFNFRFDFLLVMAWVMRWWLFPVQLIVLLFWLRARERRVRHSMP
jgi:hypothetical protein